MNKFSKFAVCALLAGCSFAPPAPTAQEQNDASLLVLCASSEDCALRLRRAQAWLAQNSRYRIRIATDTLVETFGPVLAETALAYRVVLVPRDGGRGIVEVQAACGNHLGCDLSPIVATARLKNFIRQP